MMKSFVIILCIAVFSSAVSVPVRPAHSSALDLLDLLENIIEEEGHDLVTKVVHLIHKIEEGVVSLKDLVPKTYQNIHDEADEVLSELKKLAEDVRELLDKKSGNVLFGFDLNFLGGLTELTGGTKLSTVISVLQLADKAHKVMEDAKKLVPNLEKELNKMEGKLEAHATDLATRILKELGMNGVIKQHGVIHDIEDLVVTVEINAHKLILDLLRNMEVVFKQIEIEYPETYKKIEHKIEDLRKEAGEVITTISKHVKSVIGYGLLDFAGDLTEGTSLGTALKVVSLVNKFNIVLQDVKSFEPKSEIFLKHTVVKVESSAQEFFKHIADAILTF